MKKIISTKQSALITKIILGAFISIAIAVLIFSIIIYIDKFGSLEGDIVFDFENGVKYENIDSLKVFLILGKIDSTLKLLDRDYINNISPLEKKVDGFKKIRNESKEKHENKELAIRIAFGNRPSNSQNYRNEMVELENLKTLKDKYNQDYKILRENLINRQLSYNKQIAVLIDNNVVLKSVVDDHGHFSFKKVRRGDYFLYALKVFVGNEDITNVPGHLYYIFAMTGKPMKKYSWMEKLTVDEKSYIKLDKSNMYDVFK